MITPVVGEFIETCTIESASRASKKMEFDGSITKERTTSQRVQSCSRGDDS